MGLSWNRHLGKEDMWVVIRHVTSSSSSVIRKCKLQSPWGTTEAQEPDNAKCGPGCGAARDWMHTVSCESEAHTSRVTQPSHPSRRNESMHFFSRIWFWVFVALFVTTTILETTHLSFKGEWVNGFGMIHVLEHAGISSKRVDCAAAQHGCIAGLEKHDWFHLSKPCDTNTKLWQKADWGLCGLRAGFLLWLGCWFQGCARLSVHQTVCLKWYFV